MELPDLEGTSVTKTPTISESSKAPLSVSVHRRTPSETSNYSNDQSSTYSRQRWSSSGQSAPRSPRTPTTPKEWRRPPDFFYEGNPTWDKVTVGKWSDSHTYIDGRGERRLSLSDKMREMEIGAPASTSKTDKRRSLGAGANIVQNQTGRRGQHFRGHGKVASISHIRDFMPSDVDVECSSTLPAPGMRAVEFAGGDAGIGLEPVIHEEAGAEPNVSLPPSNNPQRNNRRFADPTVFRRLREGDGAYYAIDDGEDVSPLSSSLPNTYSELPPPVNYQGSPNHHLSAMPRHATSPATFKRNSLQFTHQRQLSASGSEGEGSIAGQGKRNSIGGSLHRRKGSKVDSIPFASGAPQDVPSSHDKATTILDVHDFPSTFQTADLHAIFGAKKSEDRFNQEEQDSMVGEVSGGRGSYRIKWMTDTRALVVFESPQDAKKAYLDNITNSKLKIRPYTGPYPLKR